MTRQCDQCPEPIEGPHHPECYRFVEASNKMKRQIQPAKSPLAYFCDIPQWRCSRGCWEDVTKQTCYGHGEHGPHCEECGGDGTFEEIRCEACAGYGMQWDWPEEGRRENSAAPHSRTEPAGSSASHPVTGDKS